MLALLAWVFLGKRTYKKSRYGRFPPFDQKGARRLPDSTTVCGSAYVVDGDTLIIQKTQIRLFGIEAPELDHPYGKNAKSALISLCKGKRVRAEVIAQDAHGRTVAQCWLEDGRDISAEMVKLGLAIDWAKFSGGKYRSLEVPGVRRKLWLADARQNGRMHVWEQYEARAYPQILTDKVTGLLLFPMVETSWSASWQARGAPRLTAPRWAIMTA